MALERWAQVQDRKGNALGAKLVRLLAKDYGDIPYPGDERQKGIKRFAPEGRKALEAMDAFVVGLTGQSIGSLRAAGRKFYSIWHEWYPEFEALPSRRSEVAIFPRERLFIPGSNDKSLQEQQKMVQEFSRKLSKKIKGVEAIIGEAPDYAELVFAYLDATGEWLFWGKHDYDYARTKTPSTGYRVADVGGDADSGLRIGRSARDRGGIDLFALPLVVPK